MELSIVVPAFNEARRLPASLRKMAEFCAGYANRCEVIIVVERSADRTLELANEAAAKQANFRVIGNDVQRGKGCAVRTGMLAARGEAIFYMDADLSVPVEHVSGFVTHFEANPEIAVIAGNRQHPHSRILHRQSWLRQTMGQTFNHIVRALSGLELRDTQCGFKAFRRHAAHEIFARQRIDGFAFDVEVLLLARRLGFAVADLPVLWSNSTGSKVRIVRDSVAMLRDAWKIRRSLQSDPCSHPERSTAKSRAERSETQ